MNRDCRRIRELLSAHLDGELAAADERRVEEHLSECAACRAILAAYRDADAAFMESEAALTESEWERLAARIDDTIAREAPSAHDKRRPGREAAWEPAGLHARWRSLLGGMSARRLGLGALGSLTVAALIILLFPWREEVRISGKVDEEKAPPVLVREGPKKSAGKREPMVLRTAQEPISDEARFEQLRLNAEEAIGGGGGAEALAAAQALDAFLTDSPASPQRLEALELAARVWVRLSEIDPARHCAEARARVRNWEAAAGDSASPQMRELLRGFRQGPCAP